MREIFFDCETTGLFTADGHRIVEVGAVEMIDGKLTGKTFHAEINPARSIPKIVSDIHGITDEKIANAPVFADIAQGLRDFIGDAPVVITCRTKDDGYTLDIAFLEMEFAKAGVSPVPESQFVNVRRWSEAMYGQDEARLDQLLDRFMVDRSARTQHGALLDAALLAEVYPKLQAAYKKFCTPPPKSGSHHKLK